ncbi:N-acetylmuramidase family protein [Celerinatantimonas sp. YJH-8]|uniref:N-acetylmuramidase family protein n=1 Tax=Celerinatantimonas sp. YJH-8 TaxID=3228714 RepID=UPI0038C2636C
MGTLTLQASVGIGGENHADDVKAVQQALNQLASLIGLEPKLTEDGCLGDDPAQSKTCAAIALYQQKILHFQNPDMCISYPGKTYDSICQTLKTLPSPAQQMIPWYFLIGLTPEQGLSEDDFSQAAALLGCEVAAIQAVSDVESSGAGFFESGLPCLLFEAQQFSRLTDHQYDESHPDISSLHWDRSLYVGGDGEYQRLQKAMALNSSAALSSASYGRYQIMGFNYELAGYEDVFSFVRDMFVSEANHLKAFTHFIDSNTAMKEALAQCDWATFAKHYNGPDYAQNHYDEKLKNAYEHHSA